MSITTISRVLNNYDAIIRRKEFIDVCKNNSVNINKSFIVDRNYKIDSGYDGFIQLYGLPENP